jgi:hypothetical protein
MNMAEEIMFKGKVWGNNNSLLITIPQSSNTIDLQKEDEVVVWVRKTIKGGVHANEQV